MVSGGSEASPDGALASGRGRRWTGRHSDLWFLLCRFLPAAHAPTSGSAAFFREAGTGADPCRAPATTYIPTQLFESLTFSLVHELENTQKTVFLWKMYAWSFHWHIIATSLTADVHLDSFSVISFLELTSIFLCITVRSLLYNIKLLCCVVVIGQFI